VAAGGGGSNEEVEEAEERPLGGRGHDGPSPHREGGAKDFLAVGRDEVPSPAPIPSLPSRGGVRISASSSASHGRRDGGGGRWSSRMVAFAAAAAAARRVCSSLSRLVMVSESFGPWR